MNGTESSTPEQPKRSGDASGHRKLPDYGYVALGIFLLLVPLGFVAAFPDQYSKLEVLLRVITALGGALVGAALPGLIEVNLAFARGAGAMGLLLLIYLVNPPALVQSNPAVPPVDSRTLSSGGGKCLDADSRDFRSNGGKIQVWDCHDGDNQQWHFDNVGRLVNGGGKCLDADSVADAFRKKGGKVQVWDCHDEVNQRWEFDDANRLVNGGGKQMQIGLIQSNGGKARVWIARY